METLGYIVLLFLFGLIIIDLILIKVRKDVGEPISTFWAVLLVIRLRWRSEKTRAGTPHKPRQRIRSPTSV